MRISRKTRAALKAALREDIGAGDRSSKLLIAKEVKARALVIARQKGIFCGRAVVGELARQADPRLKIRWRVREGASVKRGAKLFTLEGRLRSLLKLERTLLNLVSHLSGVSTSTNLFVKKVKKQRVKILDTRKTTPLWRELEKYAVSVGGGSNHRKGLYDEVFVKENHRHYGSLEKLKKMPRRFVLEVRNLKELKEGLILKPRVLLFDNFSPRGLKKAVRLARQQDKKVLLEASGGITLKNIAAYARTGVDQISIGSLTHSVKALNLSMIVA